MKRAITESTYLFKAGGKAAGLLPSAPAAQPDGATSVAELVAELTKDMLAAADNLEFERAAYLRDQIKELKKKGLPHHEPDSTDAPASPARRRAAGGKRGARRRKA